MRLINAPEKNKQTRYTVLKTLLKTSNIKSEIKRFERDGN